MGDDFSPNKILSNQERAQWLGVKLAIFIAALNLSLAEKDAFFALLDFFSLKELETLTQILESIYLNQQTQAVDQVFADTIKQIKDGDETKSHEILQKALADLTLLSLEIKAKE